MKSYSPLRRWLRQERRRVFIDAVVKLRVRLDWAAYNRAHGAK